MYAVVKVITCAGLLPSDNDVLKKQTKKIPVIIKELRFYFVATINDYFV